MCRSQHLVCRPHLCSFGRHGSCSRDLGGEWGGGAASTGVLRSVWIRGSWSRTGENWMLPLWFVVYLFLAVSALWPTE